MVQDSTSADPYQNFVPELLTTEGLNSFQVAQLRDLTSAFLTNYDVVILPHLTLTAAQATLFQNYVNAGGTLVGFRPDRQLASVFGVASLGTTLQEAWLKIDTTTSYAPSMDSEAMKFHGAADLYSLNSASALATLYYTTTLPTTSPAAAINSYGLGKAILFSFDLTQSIVLMRQGNPAWAGYPNNHDSFNTMRPSQMFMDQPSGQFWNDLGDGALNDVPQADIQLRLFSNAVTLTNAPKRPLPRLWYFPNQSRAQLLMTGDDHSFPVSEALSEVNNIATYGGLFSYNLWYHFGSVSNSQVNAWLTAGDTMAIHFDDTGEVDSSGVGGSAASWRRHAERDERCSLFFRRDVSKRSLSGDDAKSLPDLGQQRCEWHTRSGSTGQAVPEQRHPVGHQLLLISQPVGLHDWQRIADEVPRSGRRLRHSGVRAGHPI